MHFLNAIPIVLVSYGCQNKVSEIKGLETTKNYTHSTGSKESEIQVAAGPCFLLRL